VFVLWLEFGGCLLNLPLFTKQKIPINKDKMTARVIINCQILVLVGG